MPVHANLVRTSWDRRVDASNNLSRLRERPGFSLSSCLLFGSKQLIWDCGALPLKRWRIGSKLQTLSLYIIQADMPTDRVLMTDTLKKGRGQQHIKSKHTVIASGSQKKTNKGETRLRSFQGFKAKGFVGKVAEEKQPVWMFMWPQPTCFLPPLWQSAAALDSECRSARRSSLARAASLTFYEAQEQRATPPWAALHPANH